MRGLIKVAALLSSTLTTAFVIPVIPDSLASHSSGGIIFYDQKASEASVKFTIHESDANPPYPFFVFSVSNVEKPCGETNVKLNGQPLESQWAGLEAYGKGYLDAYSTHEAIWSITCLHDPDPSDGSLSDGSNVVHLLRLRFGQSNEGFTISYKQAGKVAMVRFSPSVVDTTEVISLARQWRQPSPTFDQGLSMVHEIHDEQLKQPKSWWHGPQSLLSSVTALQNRLKNKLLTLTGCYKQTTNASHVAPLAATRVQDLLPGNETRSTIDLSESPKVADKSDKDDLPASVETKETVLDHFQPANIDTTEDASTAIFPPVDATKTLVDLSAAETRSLHTPEELAYLTSAAGPSPSTSAPDTELKYKTLKIFGLTLILLSVLVLCLLRCKDPRWRAERAARREEKRTKRLYKIAARKHKIKTFLSKVRTKIWTFTLVSKLALVWNEKETQDSGTENLLESLMEDDIRALRTVHRAVSNITAAEEGRNQFQYDEDNSRRRRSVSTLPGYESDGGQLPPYEASRNFGMPNLANGAPFTSADVDSNPASSVVSTSPRISRDGTNSDFDEKFEALSLDQNPKSDRCR